MKSVFDGGAFKIKGEKLYLYGMTFVLFVGVFLRLYMIGIQQIMDDEWHAINMATLHSFSYIFTHYSSTDHCIPLTLFYKFLMETTGLNEWGFRAPQILLGTMAVVLFPLIVKKQTGTRVAVIFGFLIAISPFLIFYSRFARPYSIVVFLSFVAVMSIYGWFKSGDNRLAVVYVLTGVIAIFFHLFSAVIVLAPPAYFILVILLAKIRKIPQIDNSPSLLSILRVVFFLAIGVMVWLTASFESLKEIAGLGGRGFITVNSMYRVSGLLTGQYQPFLIGLVLIFGLTGFYRLFKKDIFFGGLVFITVVLQFLAIIVSSPLDINIPICFSRYFIVVLPLCLLAVATGIEYLISICVQRFLNGKEQFTYPLIALTLLVLFCFGPIPRNYSYLNSFITHSAYQEDYTPLKWDRPRVGDYFGSYISYSNEISDFYKTLADEKGDITIIEYPKLEGDHFNLYYYYQHIHQKRVKIGIYSPSDKMNFYLENSGIRFNNLVNMGDLEAVRNSGAKYIVIHHGLSKKVLFFEKMDNPELYAEYAADPGLLPENSEPYLEQGIIVYETFVNEQQHDMTLNLIEKLSHELGEPEFKDAFVTVYKIGRGS